MSAGLMIKCYNENGETTRLIELTYYKHFSVKSLIVIYPIIDFINSDSAGIIDEIMEQIIGKASMNKPHSSGPSSHLY